jgi:hypothetical protein
MRTLNWFTIFCAFFLASAFSVNSAPRLSALHVKQLYKDGEFESLKEMLEKFLKNSGSNSTIEDRIVAYKYLGVVCASLPGGAPQAEAYFFRLLDLSPQVQLTELYVSSSINNLFEKTQGRFIKERQSAKAVDELGFGRRDKGERPDNPEKAAPGQPHQK